MGRLSIGINLEFVRSLDKPFEWGVAKAAELGYQYVEPMVHLGRQLTLSIARLLRLNSPPLFTLTLRRGGNVTPVTEPLLSPRFNLELAGSTKVPEGRAVP